ALASGGVSALGVLTEEPPVDTLLGHRHRADVCKEVERLAQRDVGTLDVRPLVALARGGGRTLEDDVALLYLGENVVRDCAERLGAVLDGEPVDVAELDLAGGDLVAQQVLEDA